ncbi:MAG: InlB B-repeat-containing protein [Methanobrevibacter sp.]|nr:InlB B-repeat-containing protein [Methanobrevibacter sp.]
MNIKRIVILLVLAIALCSLTVATVHAVAINPEKNEKSDTGLVIESKSKTVTCKITWNANNGKIGSRKVVTSTVKKGSKINKLISTPKRSGYIFEGWYSKKNGGKKISQNIKITKSTTLYAHWKKKGSTSANSQLQGYWSNRFQYYDSGYSYTGSSYYSFSKDGTFKSFSLKALYGDGFKGKYKVSGAKIYFTDISGYSYEYLSKRVYGQKKYNNKVIMEHKTGKNNKGEYLDISRMVDIPNTEDKYFRFALASRYDKEDSNPFSKYNL